MNGEICSPPKEEELKLKGFAYLLKLEADQNHNRYYRMVQEGDRFKIEMSTLRAGTAASALRGLCDSGGAVYPLPRLAAAAGIERRGGRAVSLRGRGFPARWRCGCTAGAGRRVGRRACAIPPRRGGRCLEKSGLRPRFHAVFRRCCVYLGAVLCTAANVYPVG